VRDVRIGSRCDDKAREVVRLAKLNYGIEDITKQLRSEVRRQTGRHETSLTLSRSLSFTALDDFNGPATTPFRLRRSFRVVYLSREDGIGIRREAERGDVGVELAKLNYGIEDITKQLRSEVRRQTGTMR
jgi:hypothetical protein